MTDQQAEAASDGAPENDYEAPAAHTVDENPLDHVGAPVPDPVLGV